MLVTDAFELTAVSVLVDEDELLSGFNSQYCPPIMTLKISTLFIGFHPVHYVLHFLA